MIGGKRRGSGGEKQDRQNDTGKLSPECSFLPDLSLWYDWHASRGTLPADLEGKSLSGVAAELDVRGWIPYAPWRADFPDLEVSLVRGDKEIARTVRTSKGRLTSRWVLGPDGDWWQSEYPVKTADDLDAAYEYCRNKTYRPEGKISWAGAGAEPGKDILAIKLPQQPFSDVLHDLLGFDEGIIILMQEGERIAELTEELARSYTELLSSLISLVDEIDSGSPDAEKGEIIFYSPDNLDANFISPPFFDSLLREGYEATLRRLHEADYGLAVHIGGYVKPLLAGLGELGIDILQGISGPPQSDAALCEARERTGTKPLLWGGIPQDLVLAAAEEKALDECLRELDEVCAKDGRIVAGISDKVPVEADLEKLRLVRNFFKKVT
jgi:hypothetical protein